MKTDVHLWQYLAELFLDKCFKENPNTHFVFNTFFFWKSYRLWDNVEKYGTVTQTT